MRCLSAFLAAALNMALAVASPLPAGSRGPCGTDPPPAFRLARRPVNVIGSTISWLCSKKANTKMCQTIQRGYGSISSRTGVTVTLSNGIITGATTSNGGTRYTVPYAQPPVGSLRFKDPVAVKGWTGTYNASGTPPPCPQNMDSSMASTNEDCLYLQVYTPPSSSSGNLPVFVWVHGGSFLTGGSTAAGLDGSTLAAKENVVVVTMQYRLGMLGLLKASRAGVTGNLAVKDAMMALGYIQTNAGAFGGDASKVTLAGQSSGADLIKTLLTVPSADGLFARAILHSSPLNYGDQASATADAVGNASLSALGCSTLSCLQGLSVSAILTAQSNVYSSVPATNAAIASSEPFKPWVDGALVSQDFLHAINGANGGLTNKNRHIIFTTVKNEAAPTIYSVSSSPIDSDYFDPVVQGLLTPTARYDALINSGLYNNELNLLVQAANQDATRDELDVLGTDYIWRCSSQQAAANLTALASMGGNIFLAEFDIGIPYPSSQSVPFCTGKVCHEDDIYAVFGTGTGLSSAQTALSDEVQARWGAFAATGSPNADGYVTWPAVASASNLNLLTFNPGVASTVSATQRPSECGADVGIWGRSVPFDAQYYS